MQSYFVLIASLLAVFNYEGALGKSKTDITYLKQFVDRVYQLESVCDGYEDLLRFMGFEGKKLQRLLTEKPIYALGMDKNKLTWVRLTEAEKDTTASIIEFGKKEKEGNVEWTFTADKNILREDKTYTDVSTSERKKIVTLRDFSENIFIHTIHIDDIVCPSVFRFVATQQQLIAEGIKDKIITAENV